MDNTRPAQTKIVENQDIFDKNCRITIIRQTADLVLEGFRVQGLRFSLKDKFNQNDDYNHFFILNGKIMFLNMKVFEISEL